jgi:uncharacterized membrane protein YhhN
LVAAAVAGVSYFPASHALADGAAIIAWKGAGVGLLAAWAAAKARGIDGWWIAGVMALGALGDVLLEAVGLAAGAAAFLAGHVAAILFYLRHRRRRFDPFDWFAAVLLFGVPLAAYLLPDNPTAARDVAAYSAGLGGMVAAAWISRFPRGSVALGALMFVISDLLIFARLGPLAGDSLPGLLIWPLYFIGQLMIATGVVRTLGKEAAA